MLKTLQCVQACSDTLSVVSGTAGTGGFIHRPLSPLYKNVLTKATVLCLPPSGQISAIRQNGVGNLTALDADAKTIPLFWITHPWLHYFPEPTIILDQSERLCESMKACRVLTWWGNTIQYECEVRARRRWSPGECHSSNSSIAGLHAWCPTSAAGFKVTQQ